LTIFHTHTVLKPDTKPAATYQNLLPTSLHRNFTLTYKDLAKTTYFRCTQ